MKKKDIKELRSKPLSELQKLLGDSRERLQGLRFNLDAGKVKNFQEVRELRRYIARIFTFIKENNNKK